MSETGGKETDLDSITTIDEAREAAINVLKNDYGYARKAVGELEVYRKAKSEKAVFQIRDFIDHLHFVFCDDCTVKEAIRRLHDAQHHLRKCIVEPAEYQAEYQIVEIDKITSHWIYRLPFIPRLPTDKEFYKSRAKAQALIANGRTKKASIEAYDSFKESCEIGSDLLYKLQAEPHGPPTRHIWRAVIWLVPTALVAIGVAVRVCVWAGITPHNIKSALTPSWAAEAAPADQNNENP